MSELTLPRFACEGCAKSYKWKPELSLKRVRCGCGATMTVPDLTPPPAVEDDGPPPLPDDDIFAMLDSAPTLPTAAAALVTATGPSAAVPVARPAKGAAKAPAARAAVAVPGRAAAVPVPAGPRRADGTPILPYRGKGGPNVKAPPKRGGFETFYDLKRDVYLPTGLIAGSLIVYMGLALFGSAAHGRDVGLFGIGLLAMIGIKTVALIVGAFIVAPLAGVSFGPIWTAILKLAALTVTTDVLVSAIAQLSPGGGMTFATSLAGVFCYWGLLCVLFDMDLGEARLVASLFGVMRFILTIGLILLFAGGLVGKHYGGDDAAPTPSEEAAQVDENVAAKVEDGHTEEALAYIKRTGRQSGQQGLTEKAYDAGAKNVFFVVAKDINGHAEPLSLIVEWPRDAKKRAAVLAAINAAEREKAAAIARNKPEWGKIPPNVYTDTGGKYLEVSIGF